jgi:hypothetical protein
VAQGNGSAAGVQLRESAIRFELVRPHVIESHNLQSFDVMNLIPKDGDTKGLYRLNDLLCNFWM